MLLGGESRKSEKARLRKGVNIVLGTPGRLIDHLEKSESLKQMEKLDMLVLDEADRFGVTKISKKKFEIFLYTLS